MKPRVHLVDGLAEPCFGICPVAKAAEEEWPAITEEKWYGMALATAEGRQGEFYEILALCQRKARNPNMAFPAEVAAHGLYNRITVAHP